MWILARSNRTCGSHRLVQLFGAWNGLRAVRLGLSVRCWVLREHAIVVLLRTTGSAPSPNQFPGWEVKVAHWWAGFWLFFENYTVDASIFVVKL